MACSDSAQRFSLDSLIVNFGKRAKLCTANRHQSKFRLVVSRWFSFLWPTSENPANFNLTLLLLRIQVIIVYFFAAYWKFCPAWLSGSAVRATLENNRRVGFTGNSRSGSYFDSDYSANESWMLLDRFIRCGLFFITGLFKYHWSELDFDLGIRWVRK